MSQEIIAEDSQVDSEYEELNESEQELDVNDEESAELDGDEQLESQAEESEDDSEEVEFNDRQYKLPKDIAEGVKSMRKDYTEKTMAVAEQRKAVEAQEQFYRQNIEEVASVVALNNQLKEFAQLDWNSLVDSDPVLAQKLQIQQQGLTAKRDQLAQSVAHKEQHMKLQQQQEFAKLVESSETVLKREIKEWSPDLEAKLHKFGIELGYTPDEVRNSKTDPRSYKLLYKAWLGDQAVKKQLAKSRPELAKPVTTLKGKGVSTGNKPPAERSFAEYQKWRKQGN